MKKQSKNRRPAKKARKGVVLAFGTFDLLHPGHLFYLGAARELGKKLVVIVARDSNVKHFKGVFPVNNEKTRLTVIQSLKDVDQAVLGQRSKFFSIIKKFNPEKIALGYDQWPGIPRLKQYLKENEIPARIVRLPAFKARIYKSTHIKKKIKKKPIGWFNSCLRDYLYTYKDRRLKRMKSHEHHVALINGLSRELKPIFDHSEQAIYLYLDDIHKSCNRKFSDLLGYQSPEQWATITEPFPATFVEKNSQKTLVTAFQKAMEKMVGSKIKVVWKKKTGKPVKTGVILIPIRYKKHLFALHFISRH